MESTVANRIELAQEKAQSATPSIGVIKIAAGVFLGNLTFAIVAYVMYGLIVLHW